MLCLPACYQHSSGFGDMTRLNNEERHTQPLKTALNSRVPQNSASARRQRGHGGEEGQKRRRELYNCNYFSDRLRSWLPVVWNHQRTLGDADRAAVSAPDTGYSSQTNFSHRLQSTTYN